MNNKKSKRPAGKRSRRTLIALAVTAVVVAAAVTVISRQNSAAISFVKAAPSQASSASATVGHTYVTRRVGGQDIQIDTQTGQVRPLTPQEAQKLAEGLAPMVDQSTEGLVQVRHPDGSVSMDLQGRFQDVAVARITTDGTVQQSCVDNPRAAAQFFGISQKAIEDAQAAQRKIRTIQSPN